MDEKRKGPNVMRSRETIKVIKFQTYKEGRVEPLIYDHPVGEGWGRGGKDAIVDLRNAGWEVYDTYLANQQREKAEAERQVAEAQARVKAEVELRAKVEAETRAKVEAEQKAKAEAEAEAKKTAPKKEPK